MLHNIRNFILRVAVNLFAKIAQTFPVMIDVSAVMVSLVAQRISRIEYGGGRAALFHCPQFENFY